VLNALDKRAIKMKKQAEDAEAATKEAEKLKQQYEARLEEWAVERGEERRALADELAKERKVRFEELQHSLKDERERAATRAQATRASQEVAMLRKAEEQAYGNTASMLTRLADQALTVRIAKMVTEDIGSLTEEKCNALRRAVKGLKKNESMEITTAHELSDVVKRTLVKAMEQATGHQQIPYKVNLSLELIAGVRIALGEMVLHANLADELTYFRREELHG
jgi:F-type H+-transporting ATPase subunit b